jgi:hypothetical protein
VTVTGFFARRHQPVEIAALRRELDSIRDQNGILKKPWP